MTQESIASLIPFILILLIGLVMGGIIGIILAGSLQSPSQNSKAQANRNLSQVAGLWRDKRNQNLIIEIDQKYYLSVDKLPSRQESTLIQIFNDLRSWLRYDVSSVRPGDEPQAGLEVDRLNDRQPIKPLLAQQLPIIPVVEEIEPVKADVSEIVTRAINPKEKSKKKEPPKSIVEQVDEILQKRLTYSAFHDRVIRLVEAPGGGLEVLIDAQRYEGVAEVPDLEVRNFIQECVKEWENKK